MNFRNTAAALFACTAIFSSSVFSVSAAEHTVAPDTYANFTVADSEGNLLSDASMQILDTDGNVIASWDGNSMSSLNSTYAAGSSFSKPAQDLLDIPDVDNEIINRVKLDNTSLGNTCYLKYGSTHTAALYYNTNEATSLTVPANKMLLNVDSRLSQKTSKFGIGIGPDIMDKKTYSCNEIIGKETLYDMEAGVHKTYLCLDSSAASGGNITISDKPVSYIKKTINLHEVAPSYFNADGTTTRHNEAFNFGIDEDKKKAFMYIISGSVVNVVVPDENSDVTIYIESTTNKYSYATHFISNNGTGGGTSGITLDFSNIYNATLNAVSLPSSGINLVDIEPGEYVFRQTNTINGYTKPEDIKFTISDTDELQSFRMINNAAKTTTSAIVTTSPTMPETTTDTTKPSTSAAVTTTTEMPATTSEAADTALTTTSETTTTSATTTTTSATTSKATASNTGNCPTPGDKGVSGLIAAMAVSACAIFVNRKSK